MITVQTSNLSIMYINITDHNYKLANKFLNSLLVCALITSVGNEFHSFTVIGKKNIYKCSVLVAGCNNLLLCPLMVPLEKE